MEQKLKRIGLAPEFGGGGLHRNYLGQWTEKKLGGSQQMHPL